MRLWTCVLALCAFPLLGIAREDVGAEPAGPPHAFVAANEPAAAETGSAPAGTTGNNETDNAYKRGGLYAGQLKQYEPIYFSYNWRYDNNAKLQVSFKYELYQREKHPDCAFYFGVTQTAIWDLEHHSVPFHDSSNRPSLFYEVHHPERPDDRFSRNGWRAGIEHESNGKAGPDSRGINILFFRPDVSWGSRKHGRLTFAPRIYGYLSTGGSTHDIARYRGFADLFALYEAGQDAGFFKATRISGTYRKGTESYYGSFQGDVAFPLGTTFYLHLQVFQGFGETILDYNKRVTTQYRVGFMLISW